MNLDLEIALQFVFAWGGVYMFLESKQSSVRALFFTLTAANWLFLAVNLLTAEGVLN